MAGERRRDFRMAPTFTIDPADARDLDDALSFQKLPGGKSEVGIHIADVAHYVKPGTALDREAARRGTSVYLVDRTIPMLPEFLSNDLCSLNPQEDKLTFSAIFTFDSQRRLKSEWFGRTIIRSNKRFSYEEVDRILKTKAGPYAPELLALNRLAGDLRKERLALGAIDFAQEEIKFVLDRRGRPVKVFKKEPTAATRLVEELMLLANRRVAEFVSRIIGRGRGFVYRIHDQPDLARLRELSALVAPLGYQLPVGPRGVSVQSLNKLLGEVSGRPEENLVKTLALRSLAKAVYSTKNIGHYGLAFTHYAHFTSPIRRYPDLMAHRLLDLYLSGKRPAKTLLRRYDQLAVHCSEREAEAQEAERASIKQKLAEYFKDQVGQVFRGLISGVTRWGIYVQEEKTSAEGLVHVSRLRDDYYIFDEKNFALVGKRQRRRYRLGDRVRVKLLRADPETGYLDFLLV